jgi:hypothetical protein
MIKLDPFRRRLSWQCPLEIIVALDLDALVAIGRLAGMGGIEDRHPQRNPLDIEIPIQVPA